MTYSELLDKPLFKVQNDGGVFIQNKFICGHENNMPK